MYGYIYLILNKVNGKTYVGKHELYKKAWNEDNYMGSGILLKPAQKKYGIENFEKFLIEYTFSEEDACKKEEFWIAEYKSRGKAEYNISKGGDGGYILKYASEEKKDKWKKKISKAAKKYIGENNGFYGKHHSEESRKKMAESRKGRKLSDEWKRKIGEAGKGKHFGPMSEEQKKKLSEIAKLSEARKGRHWYNNGIKNTLSKTCPEGFVPGKLI